MKKLFLLAICSTILVLTACRKNNDCTRVIITDSAPGCGGWGIVVNGVKYPSATIPSAFQQNGLTVCADYELYDDMRACACCGGTWAKINSMRNLNQ
jgi:hypothetical protein